MECTNCGKDTKKVYGVNNEHLGYVCVDCDVHYDKSKSLIFTTKKGTKGSCFK